jgi:hypothetical protein
LKESIDIASVAALFVSEASTVSSPSAVVGAVVELVLVCPSSEDVLVSAEVSEASPSPSENLIGIASVANLLVGYL